MIKIDVPEGESLEVSIAGYTFFIAKMEEDRVEVSRWFNGHHRQIDLNPAEDALPPVDLRDVPLDRNLTQKRLPEEAQTADTIRVIVWEKDADTGSRSILDIVEGTRSQIIRFFNGNREMWASTGGSKTARIEVVKQEREGIWA